MSSQNHCHTITQCTSNSVCVPLTVFSRPITLILWLVGPIQEQSVKSRTAHQNVLCQKAFWCLLIWSLPAVSYSPDIYGCYQQCLSSVHKTGGIVISILYHRYVSSHPFQCSPDMEHTCLFPIDHSDVRSSLDFLTNLFWVWICKWLLEVEHSNINTALAHYMRGSIRGDFLIHLHFSTAAGWEQHTHAHAHTPTQGWHWGVVSCQHFRRSADVNVYHMPFPSDFRLA